jgi:hypothetical protein
VSKDQRTALARLIRDECMGHGNPEMWFGIIANGIDQAVASEREACAKIAEYQKDHAGDYAAKAACQRVANGIRVRSEK